MTGKNLNYASQLTKYHSVYIRVKCIADLMLSTSLPYMQRSGIFTGRSEVHLVFPLTSSIADKKLHKAL